MHEKVLAKKYVLKKGIHIIIYFKQENAVQRQSVFMKKVPGLMRERLSERVPKILKSLGEEQINLVLDEAIQDTRFSPTVNLNGLFSLTKQSA